MSTRRIEPIPRRRSRYPGESGSPINPRIPLGGMVNCGLENLVYSTQREAYQAAIVAARRLNQIQPGHIVKFEGKHRAEELPHYHILTPNQERCRGHFYYGRQPYFAPKRNPPLDSWNARKAKRKFQRESEYSNQWLFEAPLVPNQKYLNESEWNWESNGCRTVTSTFCPGQKGQFTQIDYFPRMFLVNYGSCTLYIASLLNGRLMTNINNLELLPGQSATFVPHQGANGVGFACHMGCQGNGLLEHPYLCA